MYIFVLKQTRISNLSKYDPLPLFIKIQSGDKQAFAELYDKYSGALYGICLSILLSEGEAQDALQDSFVKIWKNSPKYDPKKGSLFTWMLNISRNTCIDRYRKKSKMQLVEIQNEEGAVSKKRNHFSETKVNHIGLRELTGKLVPDQIEIIDYLYYKGYTQQETSDALELPLGTVKTRARIAIRELRKYFGTT